MVEDTADEIVLKMRDMVGPGVLEFFAVEAELPPVQFVEGLPGPIAFAYTREEGEEHIAVDPHYDDRGIEGILALQWGMAEEHSHFCHYMLNRGFFMRRIDLTEDESVRDNKEALEMDNLGEFIARMGGLASGVCLPPDFGRTMEAWKKLTRIPGAAFREEFEGFVESHPDYAKDLSYASARVWGAGLADCFLGEIKGNIPRYREIIRNLTQCRTFDEAADVFEGSMPGSKEAKEVRLVKEKLFSN